MYTKRKVSEVRTFKEKPSKVENKLVFFLEVSEVGIYINCKKINENTIKAGYILVIIKRTCSL